MKYKFTFESREIEQKKINSVEFTSITYENIKKILRSMTDIIDEGERNNIYADEEFLLLLFRNIYDSEIVDEQDMIDVIKGSNISK